jgi:hypothetical protein
MIVDPDFCDHWKTRMLVGALDGDECAPLYVLRLWAHCQNRRQSTFENISQEALKALCRFPGNSNKLESSLVTSGFVRREGKVLIVVGWDEYNSSLIAAWNNGTKGGRPPKFKSQNNPAETQEKPTGIPTGEPLSLNPGVCDKIRVDEIGEDTNKNKQTKCESDKAISPFPGSVEFSEAAKQYIKTRTAKHGPPAESTIEAWWFDIARFPVDEAIRILRFSTSAEAKKPITNGDHSKTRDSPSNQFASRGFGKKRMSITEMLGEEK